MSLLVGDQNRNAWQAGEKIDVQTMGVRRSDTHQKNLNTYQFFFSLLSIGG